MKTLKQTLKENTPKKEERKPLWQGPCGKGPQGGVTQSLLARYLGCPERFRIHAVEGLQPNPTFQAAQEFGNMWHACEEEFARTKGQRDDWQRALIEYKCNLGGKFSLQREEIEAWYDKCRNLFPRYVDYWAKHPDVKNRTPLMQEQAFDVPYTLPSGRVVRLRGKFDSVDLIDEKPSAGIYIQENKTKSTIDGTKIQRQLRFDLQTMMYVIALETGDKLAEKKDDPEVNYFESLPARVKGVRYNVVRRSAHKSVESMLKKFDEDRESGRIGEWFARWRVEISAKDVEMFRRTCIDPVLENLCDDYEWWTSMYQVKDTPFDLEERKEFSIHRKHYHRHYRLPYGVYSPVHEGGFGDVDNYLETGSTVGLRRVDNLFPELQ